MSTAFRVTGIMGRCAERGRASHGCRVGLPSAMTGDLALIATALGVEAVPPELIGANLVISGLDSFSSIAPGSRLAFGGNWGGKGAFDGTAVLRVEGFNHPCRGPGRQLAVQFGRPELEFAFVKAAKHLRGLILSVDAPGRIAPGDAVVLVPPVRAPLMKPPAA
jgi:MOSC domain-containing protein YiiM